MGLKIKQQSGGLRIEFLYQNGDDPFVCGVYGKVTASVLLDIEKQAIEDSDELFNKGDGFYSFDAVKFDGQFSEGRCEIPPCWELCEADFCKLSE